MVIKFILLFLLLLIVLSLGAGMFSLIKDSGETDRTVKFLTYRIILSIVAIVILVVSFLMGWIQPHGLLPPAPPG
ncbi:MAG: twin transmembrane helix small protein [Proteobacteria bacterium]|nr:twin transmembrane helix small protein [Pseudomonadota bacterium]